MVNIVINKVMYDVPVTWSEVTLRQAQALQDDVRGRALIIREYFASQFEPSAHDSSINVHNSPQLLDLFINSIHIICGVPICELRKTEPTQIEELVGKYIAHFIISLIFEPIFISQNITQFQWGGQTLCLPESGEDIQGEVMPFEKVTAEQLFHATDLHVEGSLKYAAMIVAILCRPKDELFSIRTALQRAKTMGELPMSIVLEVFFCSRRLMAI